MMKPSIPPFDAPYAEDDVAIARRLFARNWLGRDAETSIKDRSRDLITAIRARNGSLGGIDDMLREYSLSTKEGLALMVLAEALLRVPDSATADRLIEDKLGQGDFAHHEARSAALLVNASAWALGISTRIIQPNETPERIIGQLAKRLGLPAVRTAVRQAMRVLGNHFVLGQTIDEALDRARSGQGRLYRYSFDMLGEGARAAKDAERYFASYAAAIDAIGRAAGNRALPERPGISVKLSALHPRFEAVSQERVMRELTPLLMELARRAKSYDLNFTVDAEEADRLELSLAVIGAAFADPSLAGWDGFGLAIQAYQKRAEAVIRWIGELADRLGRRMMVRLVKGAYWDTEVKRAQERGLADYPVFSRKSMTDLNYAACAGLLLQMRPRIFPQFATHNALTVATILEHAGEPEGFEFQRLHGMGDALYARLLESTPGAACRVYAPVGGHRDLLAYLVRRLLENGANSSFVSAAADPEVAIEQLLRSPIEIIGAPENARQSRLPLPSQIYGSARRNSRGVEFGHRASLDALLQEIEAAKQPPAEATSLIDGQPMRAATRRTVSPIDGQTPVADVSELAPDNVGALFGAASAGFRRWSAQPASARAAALERAADLLEQRRGRFLSLLALEGGKTLDDGLAELREAVDFCRYYAVQGRALFGPGERLPGPTGEFEHLAAARARRFSLHLALEFSAGDLHGTGRGWADGRQCRDRQARRADAAYRL